MSRRKVTIKYFPAPDGTYNSYLVNILISRIVKNGKKTLAQKSYYFFLLGGANTRCIGSWIGNFEITG